MKATIHRLFNVAAIVCIAAIAEYLESLRRDAARISIAEGQSQSVSLKMIVPKQ